MTIQLNTQTQNSLKMSHQIKIKTQNLLSFELKEGIDCFDYLNRLKIAIPASNLGDTRTLVIPVAHTIYHEMGQARRTSMGIAESLIRVSVGIEDTDDLLDDFRQALNS